MHSRPQKGARDVRVDILRIRLLVDGVLLHDSNAYNSQRRDDRGRDWVSVCEASVCRGTDDRSAQTRSEVIEAIIPATRVNGGKEQQGNQSRNYWQAVPRADIRTNAPVPVPVDTQTASVAQFEQ